MSLTEDISLPTINQLTVQEINLSGPVLKAGAFHLGKACEWENNEFMLCRKEESDPRKCVNEGKAVTKCALKFFRSIKKTCAPEFDRYVHCLDQSSIDQKFNACRKTQAVYDKCVLDNLNIERPYWGYFSEVQVHKTERPPVCTEVPPVYTDPTPYLPEGTEKPPAKYGSRLLFMW